MNTFHIRFNKSRGQAGRGTMDHVWRVFENGNEYLFKHVKILVPVHDEVTGEAPYQDWNMCCRGYLTIDRETSTAIIDQNPTDK